VDNFWIIGGGKFGLGAAKAISGADSSNKLTVVEKQKTVCRQLGQLGYEAVCMDGTQYLERHLTRTHHPDWIIPAIPVHVAYEWIRTKLSKTSDVQKIAVPNDLITAFPNPIRGETGQIFISIADFKCPANCPEPDEICSYTGKPRSMILHEFLRSLQHPGFISLAIQSHQLAPGVGGYRPLALFEALNKIEAIQGPVLLGTACSCHSIIQLFEHRPK